jgi:hypothetical protein
MYYHFAILLLFRPLIKLRIIGSSVLPRDVCSQAADAIQGLLRSYSQLYTLRRTPSFVPYFVLTSSIMHLAIGVPENSAAAVSPPTESSTRSTAAPEDVKNPEHRLGGLSGPSEEAASKQPTPSEKAAQALNQGISDLTEMAPCHHFAAQALNILRYLAKKWAIEVEFPQGAGVEIPEANEIDHNVRSASDSLNFFVPNIAQDNLTTTWPVQRQRSAPLEEDSGTRGLGEKSMAFEKAAESTFEGSESQGPKAHVMRPAHRGAAGGPVAHTVQSIENPLFWPFPMQGRPVIPQGPGLEEAGFAPLWER